MMTLKEVKKLLTGRRLEHYYLKDGVRRDAEVPVREVKTVSQYLQSAPQLFAISFKGGRRSDDCVFYGMEIDDLIKYGYTTHAPAQEEGHLVIVHRLVPRDEEGETEKKEESV